MTCFSVGGKKGVLKVLLECSNKTSRLLVNLISPWPRSGTRDQTQLYQQCPDRTDQSIVHLWFTFSVDITQMERRVLISQRELPAGDNKRVQPILQHSTRSKANRETKGKKSLFYTLIQQALSVLLRTISRRTRNKSEIQVILLANRKFTTKY